MSGFVGGCCGGVPRKENDENEEGIDGTDGIFGIDGNFIRDAIVADAAAAGPATYCAGTVPVPSCAGADADAGAG